MYTKYLQATERHAYLEQLKPELFQDALLHAKLSAEWLRPTLSRMSSILKESQYR